LDEDAIRGRIVTTGPGILIGTDGYGIPIREWRVGGSRAITGYRANDARPFRIGTSCFDGILGAINAFAGNRGFDGWLEESRFTGPP
jgi:hypothetical protein